MSKISKFIIYFVAFLIIIMPAFSFAASLIPCSNTTTVAEGSATPAGTCDFGKLMTLVDTVIKFTLYFMVIPIAAIMFAYAGFSMITAPGGEAKTKAKKIFMDAVIGLVMAFAAFLIIKLVLSILGWNGEWIGFTK